MFDIFRKSGAALRSDKKNPRLWLRSRHKAHLKTSGFTAQWESTMQDKTCGSWIGKFGG